eukprot:scaffold99158_cov24-Phaeocystis_antarctica.AAC.1
MCFVCVVLHAGSSQRSLAQPTERAPRGATDSPSRRRDQDSGAPPPPRRASSSVYGGYLSLTPLTVLRSHACVAAVPESPPLACRIGCAAADPTLTRSGSACDGGVRLTACDGRGLTMTLRQIPVCARACGADLPLKSTHVPLTRVTCWIGLTAAAPAPAPRPSCLPLFVFLLP